MTYGTRALDETEYPKEIVFSDRVKATRMHLSYYIETPYDDDVRALMKDHWLNYSPGMKGWEISYRKIELARDLMAKAEDILSSKDLALENSDADPSP